MSESKIYYLVVGDGPVKDGIDKYKERILEFQKHTDNILDKYQVVELFRNGKAIIGMKFKDGECPAHFFHKKGDPPECRRPLKRMKKGKEAAKELATVTRPDIHDLARWSKSDCTMVMTPKSRTGAALAWPVFEQIGGDFVWIVPVGTSGMSKHEEMKPANTPLEGLRELKGSEYLAMKESIA